MDTLDYAKASYTGCPRKNYPSFALVTSKLEMGTGILRIIIGRFYRGHPVLARFYRVPLNYGVGHFVSFSPSLLCEI